MNWCLLRKKGLKLSSVKTLLMAFKDLLSSRTCCKSANLGSATTLDRNFSLVIVCHTAGGARVGLLLSGFASTLGRSSADPDLGDCGNLILWQISIEQRWHLDPFWLLFAKSGPILDFAKANESWMLLLSNDGLKTMVCLGKIKLKK